jgi:hypothetical protein
MPKPSSDNKNLVPQNASPPKKGPARGNRVNPNPLAVVTPENELSVSRTASGNCESTAEPSKNSSASTEPAPEIQVVPNQAPRVSIGTALCEAGFDERAVARGLVNVVQSLAQPSSTDRGGATKLLVEVLKECSRQLDNTAGHRAGEAPVVVQLVHTVSRPARPVPALTSANPSTAIEIAAPPATESSAVIESTNISTEPS